MAVLWLVGGEIVGCAVVGDLSQHSGGLGHVFQHLKRRSVVLVRMIKVMDSNARSFG